MSNLFWYAPSWEQAEDFKPNLGAARRSATGRARVKYMPPPSNMKRRLLAAGVTDRRWEREEHARRMDRRDKHGASILAESQAQRANGESAKPFEPRNTRERVHVRRGLDPDQTSKAELYRSLRHERTTTPGCHRFHASATTTATTAGGSTSRGAGSSSPQKGDTVATTTTVVPDLRLTQQSMTSSAAYRGAHAPTGQCYASYPAHADDTYDGEIIGTGRALPRSQPASPEHTPRRPASASPRKSARGVQMRDPAVETAERARHVSHMEPTAWAPGETRPSIWHLRNANPKYEAPADAAKAEAAEAGRRLHQAHGTFVEDPDTKKTAFVHRATADTAVGPDSPLSASGRFSDKGGWSTADTQNPPSKSASLQPSPAGGRSVTTPTAAQTSGEAQRPKRPATAALPEALVGPVIPLGRMALADDGAGSDIGESSFEGTKRGPMGATVSDTRKAAPKRSAFVSYATSDDQRADTSGGEAGGDGSSRRSAAVSTGRSATHAAKAKGVELDTGNTDGLRHQSYQPQAGTRSRRSPATRERDQVARKGNNSSSSDDDDGENDADHLDYRGVIPDLSRVPPRPDFRSRLTPRGMTPVDSARTNRSGGTPTRRSRGERTPNRSMLTPPTGPTSPNSGTFNGPAALAAGGSGSGSGGGVPPPYAGYPHQPQVVIVAGGSYSPGPGTGGSSVGGLMSAPGSAPGHPPPHPYFYPQANGTWSSHFPPPHPDHPQAFPHGPYANGAMSTPAGSQRGGAAVPMSGSQFHHQSGSTPGGAMYPSPSQQYQHATGYAGYHTGDHGGGTIPLDAAGSPMLPPAGSVVERGPRLTPTRRHQRHYAPRKEDGDDQDDYSVQAPPARALKADDDDGQPRSKKASRPPYGSSDVDEYERRAAEYQKAKRFLDEHDDRSPAKRGGNAAAVVPLNGAVIQDDRLRYSSESGGGTPPDAAGFSTVQQRSRDAAAQLQRDDSDTAGDDDFEVHRARPL